MFTFIYLDVNTLRLFSYILFVLTSADFRPPSTYIYREQPKSKSDSPKNFASAPKQAAKSIRATLSAYASPSLLASPTFPPLKDSIMPGRGRSHIPAYTSEPDSQNN